MLGHLEQHLNIVLGRNVIQKVSFKSAFLVGSEDSSCWDLCSMFGWADEKPTCDAHLLHCLSSHAASLNT